jgi:hypothetical protein
MRNALADVDIMHDGWMALDGRGAAVNACKQRNE